MKKIVTLVSSLFFTAIAQANVTVAVVEAVNKKVNVSSTKVTEKRFCTNSSASSCSIYTTANSSDNHPKLVTQVLDSETSQHVNMILLTGNSAGALSWIAQNASNKNIRVVNMSMSASSGHDYASLKAAGIYVVMSTGNGGLNGFNVPTSGANPAISNPAVIGAAAGFSANERLTDCYELNADKVPVQLPYDVRCNSNISSAIANTSVDNWGYVAMGCVNHDGQYGGNCGTSFAAPRVAATIAELLVINPNYSDIELKEAMDNSSCTVPGKTEHWVRGISDSQYAEYYPLHPAGAYAFARGEKGYCNRPNRVFPEITTPEHINPPGLGKEFIQCSFNAPRYLIEFSSDVSNPVYDVDWKQGNSAWFNLRNDSTELVAYTGTSNTSEHIRVRVYDATKNAWSVFSSLSFQSPSCSGTVILN